MKASRYFGFSKHHAIAATIAGLLASAAGSLASDPVDLSVSGNLLVDGSTFTLGTAISGGTPYAGVTLLYTDMVGSNPSSLIWTASRSAHEWLWERENASQTGNVPMMKLDKDHVLTIYNTSGTRPLSLTRQMWAARLPC